MRFSIALAVALMTSTSALAASDEREWLAGDHHVHTEYSVKWKPDPADPNRPPAPIKGGDARYPILTNAEMGRRYGLSWMLTSDHGGPGHDRVNAEMAYPDVVAARRAMPGFLLFYGMEFDTPGGEHSTLMMPHTPDERDRLRSIEAGFDERNAHPNDPTRDTKPKMLAALRFMAGLPQPPILIANHPSRTAKGPGVWGLHTPEEFREWQDTAPRVAIGMEAAPGHQAAVLGDKKAGGVRGLYHGSPTLGGFDQMTATLGGAWDGMLSEGRRWWVTATSDSHVNWRDRGAEFWPGEYSKTYVQARRDYADVMDGLRAGRVFAVTGDLISGVEMRIGSQPIALGEQRRVARGKPVTITIDLTLPDRPNAGGKLPQLDHVDLIVGTVGGKADTRVLHRFAAREGVRQGNALRLTHRIAAPDGPIYLRLRGTNTTEGEPTPDPDGEDPWSDLWFYTSPVFLTPGR